LLVVITTGVTLASAVGATAAPTTIDFESMTGPSQFCPPPASPLTIGAATFTGGGILTAVEGLPADQSTVYGTTPCAGYLCPLTITFSSPVSGFSVDVLNGALEPVSYTVTDNLGGSVTKTVAGSSNSGVETFMLTDDGITSVTIGPTGGCGTFWDFFIDNVRFTVVEAAPTAKSECKDGGWEAFGVFKNQGDCVSFVATDGRNRPAGDLGAAAPLG